MAEKREHRYIFTSQKDLVDFFSDTLSKKKIKEIIRTLKKTFVKRPGEPRRLKTMQFLKKCEWELVRQSKKHLAELESKQPRPSRYVER